MKKVDETGPSLEPILVPAIGRSRILTSLRLEGLLAGAGGSPRVFLDTLPDTLAPARIPAAATVSLGDTLRIVAGFRNRNRGRGLAGLAWILRYGPELRRRSLASDSGSDTLAFARKATGADTVRLVVADDGGLERKADVVVRTVSDPPVADAGGPVQVYLGDTVTLTGAGRDASGPIVRYEWAIGAGAAFQDAKDGKLKIMAPGEVMEIPCILRVTDRAGEIGLDTLLLQVTRGRMLASMQAARHSHSLVAVGGRLYALGGPYLDVANMIEEYDPATDTWKAAPSLPNPRIGLGTAVMDGKTYVMGGQRVEYYPDINKFLPRDYPQAVEAFDPVQGTWGAAPSLPRSLLSVNSTVVHGGRLYVQGLAWPSYQDIFLEFDPGPGSWRELPMLPKATEALLSVGDRLFSLSASNGTFLVNEFDPIANTLTARKSLPNRGSTLEACVIGNRIVVAGGIAGPDFVYASTLVDVYDPATDSWSRGGKMRKPRVRHALAVLGGEIYVSGGLGPRRENGTIMDDTDFLTTLEKLQLP